MPVTPDHPIIRNPVEAYLRRWIGAYTLSPITMDGDDINAITIDGDEVTEVTMDGDVVWPDEDDIPTNGLEHDYDATQLSLSDGDGVSTWDDEAGSVDLTGSAPTYRASGINGNPSVEFDGADDVLDGTGASWLSGDQAYTVCLVIDADGFAGGDAWEHAALGLGEETDPQTGDRRVYALCLEASDQTSVRKAGGFVEYGGLSTDPLIVISRYDGAGGDNDLYVNKSTESITDQSTDQDHNFQDGTVTMGASPPEGSDRISENRDIWYDGHVGRCLIYSREVSDRERDTITDVLASQFGITI